MLPQQLLGAIYALIASTLAGGADLGGGYASRHQKHLPVVCITSSMGAITLALLALVFDEGLLSTKSILFAALAGIFGVLGTILFYRSIALGHAAISSPVSAVVGAAVPVLFTAVVEGLPGVTKLAGFVVAAMGIWLTTRTSVTSEEPAKNGLLPGIIMGLCLGAFFTLIAQVEPGSTFLPLMVAKISATGVGLLFLLFRRIPLPAPRHHPVALLAGILDALTNAFYLSATKLTRVDVTAMLLCTYPAVTVLLARVIFKDMVSRSQWVGLILCLIAIGMIIT